MPLKATRSRSRYLFITSITLIVVLFWAAMHARSVIHVQHGSTGSFALAWFLAFVLLSWQVVLYSLERPHRLKPEQQSGIDQLDVTVMIPVYNEDPGYLTKCLESIFNQDRQVATVVVVDDGSEVDYDEIRESFTTKFADVGIPLIWKRTANRGKRQAQGVAVAATHEQTDIYVTVDSDGILDPSAVGELLKPFSSSKVHSVAGVVLAENNRTNLLTRLTDLWFVTSQLVDRSAASTMGAVLVNSGVLAAYRKELICGHLDSYLNETFFGRPVEFSDDSMLTLFALIQGEARQQPSAIAFTAMPQTLSHHLRQYLRWMRGASIRTFWRFRYLPLSGYAYWIHFINWIQMAISTVIFLSLFVFDPIVRFSWSPWLLFIPCLVGYGYGLRYLSIKRNDESLVSQLFTFALAPVAMMWAFFVLRLVRWYGMATCMRTGSWGTRQHGVEVGLETAD